MKRLVLLIAAATMTTIVGAWAQTSSTPSMSPPAQPGSRATPGTPSGGALGTHSGAPGTNSAGTAIPSGRATGTEPSGTVGTSNGALGTGDPAVDKEERELDRKMKSICKGC